MGGGIDETDQALAAFGLQREGHTAGTSVWPQHEQAVVAFASLLTQWRVGPKGVIGLDYAAIPVVLDLHGVNKKKRRELFDQIRVMESEAIKVLNA